ncbi:MAG: polysaccharide deacetylase family protein [Chlorobium sp.]|nr:polysaccharide deacetylase family protein [Chlorobium sp.]
MPYGKRGIAVRVTYLFVATLFFIIKKLSRKPQLGTIVLCYHGVKDVEQERFARQMRIAGKRAIAINDINNRQEKVRHDQTICITFDDAFANLIPNVLPTIDELKIPITIFIATKSIGSFPFWLGGKKHPDSCEMVMSVPQILELKKNPLIAFGSHTSSHSRLSELKNKNIREELRSSRNTLKEILNDPIENLALPHGAFNQEVLQIASEEGYRNIFTLEPAPYTSEKDAMYPTIGRFSMSPMAWPIEFFLTINGAYSWLHTWRSFIKTKL